MTGEFDQIASSPRISDRSSRRVEWSSAKDTQSTRGGLPAHPRRNNRPQIRFVAIVIGILLTAGLSVRAEGGSAHAGSPESLWKGSERDTAICEPYLKTRKYEVAKGTHSIGIPFIAPERTLHRIEVELHDRDTSDFADFRLWQWSKDLDTTRSQEPLYINRVALRSDGAWATYSVYPRIQATPGRHYYLEMRAVDPDGFAVRTGEQGESSGDSRCTFAQNDRSDAAAERAQAASTPWFRIYSEERSPLAATPPSSQDSGHIQSSTQVRSDPSLAGPRAKQRKTDPDIAKWIAPVERDAPVSSRREILTRIEQYAIRHGSNTLRSCGVRAHRFAFLHAFLYRASCESRSCNESHAKDAIELLQHASALALCKTGGPDGIAESCRARCGPDRSPVDFAWLSDPVWAYLWVRDAPSVETVDPDPIKAMFIQQAASYWPDRWRGSFNKATVAAAGYAALSKLYPESPRAKEWTNYAESVYQDVTAAMDTEEDSAHYLAESWFPGLLLLAEGLDRDNVLWAEPGFRDLVERVASYVAPVGVIPAFGDGSGFAYDSPGLVWLFEEAGHRLQSGRYRWIASRILSFNRERAMHDPPEEDSWDRFLRRLARAWLAADESVVPTAPATLGSTVTYRRSIDVRPRIAWGSPQRFSSFGDMLVPDKIIFRSGPRPTDMFALFNLLGGYRHGHPSIGSLSLLVDEASILLTETAYPSSLHEPLVENENTSMVRQFWGGLAREPGRHVNLERFDEREDVTVAWFSWYDSEGWGIKQRRHIYFLKNSGIWVRDRFEIPNRIEAAVATVWFAAALSDLRGKDWVNVSQPAPYRNVWRYRNPERYALMLLQSTEPGALEIVDRQDLRAAPKCPPPNIAGSPILAECRASPSIRVARTHRTDAGTPSQPLFDTVIVPSATPVSPAVGDDPVSVSLQVASGGVTLLELTIGAERWLVADNPDGLQFEFDGKSSNDPWKATRVKTLDP
jgi:hypothetical protein